MSPGILSVSRQTEVASPTTAATKMTMTIHDVLAVGQVLCVYFLGLKVAPSVNAEQLNSKGVWGAYTTHQKTWLISGM